MDDVNWSVQCMVCEDIREAAIDQMLRIIRKNELDIGETRAQIMVNNKRILKLERKIRKDYLQASSSKSGTEKTNETSFSANNNADIVSSKTINTNTNIGVEEDIDCIDSKAKKRERKDTEARDQDAAEERKAAYNKLIKAVKDREIKRQTKIKDVLNNVGDKLHMYPALRDIAIKHGVLGQ